MTAPILAIDGLTKDYRGLRPLRIRQLAVAPGEQVALLGFDAPSAEMFVNLVTGATLPDAGTVTVFDRPTSAIADSADWLAFVDRFGIVSERAVLLDHLSAIQNLCMPFTLDIEPPAADVRLRAEALAADVGLDRSLWERAVGTLDAAAVLRVRAGRAIALDPQLLLLEHAGARLDRGDVAPIAAELRSLASRRGLTLVALTADVDFAQAVATRVLTLAPGTGRLTESGRRGWFRLA